MNQKNLFVVGLDEFNRQRLGTLRGAEHYRFHGVIEPEEVYETEIFPIGEMLERATRELEAFDGSIDAIVGYMDFPVSTMLPILCERFGTRSPGKSAQVRAQVLEPTGPARGDSRLHPCLHRLRSLRR